MITKVRIFNSIKLLTVFFILAVFFASCKEDDEVATPSYIGTWMDEEETFSMVGDDRKFTIRTELVFTADSYEISSEIKKVDEDKWIDYSLEKGNLSATKDVLKFEASELCVNIIDPKTFEFSDKLTCVKSSDSNFDKFVEKIEAEKNHESNFIVEGNKLTLLYDHNNDGDFKDEDEQLILTKK